MSAVEFLCMAARGRGAATLLERVRIEPASAGPWSDALRLGRGVVVAASHTGNWDLAACALAKGVDLLVVTKHLRVRWLDRFWQTSRVNLADASGALRRSRDVLRRGGIVAMMIDQVPVSTRHAVLVEFLGRLALVDRAPAALAARSGAPFVIAASRRGPGGEQLLHVLDVLVPPPRASRAWIDAATATATRALERFVLDHPSQWLWLHRRWKRLDRSVRAGMLATPCPTPSSSPIVPSRAA
jgi:KDO2-lipid IV(A) lauroyltransferase